MKRRILLIPFAALMLAGGLSSCTGTGTHIAPNKALPVHHPGPALKFHKVAKGKYLPTPPKEGPNEINPAMMRDPDITGDLWDRLATGFQIPYSNQSPEVQAQVNWFIQHQKYLDTTSQRAAPYMYLVYQQTQQRHLPTELVLLPIIESAYYPFAYSSAGAAGLWQLMPGTASHLGLKRDHWYDGRRDIFASTNAALDYLTYLQSYFNGDWLLALAAYDAGEGTVSEAIKRNIREGKDTDFWSLPLPAETKSYVPRLLALANIVSNRNSYPLSLPPINDQPYLTQVDAGTQIKLTDAAKAAGMSLSQLKQLNPGYSRLTTDPKGHHKLLLPIDKVEDFKANLAISPLQEDLSLGRYRVQAGDTLDKIAASYHTTLTQLKKLNKLSSDYVEPGKILTIPPLEDTLAADNHLNLNQNQAHETNTPLSNFQKDLAATEQPPGSATSLASANNPTDESNEEPTETKAEAETKIKSSPVTVPSAPAAPAVPAPTVPPLKHVVKAGETLTSLAKHYQVSSEQLRHWNHLKAGTNHLIPGKTLIIKSSQRSVTTAIANSPHKSNHSSPSHYQVQAGDTLNSIAHQHHLKLEQLRHANHLANHSLKPGQVLIIPPAKSSH